MSGKVLVEVGVRKEGEEGCSPAALDAFREKTALILEGETVTVLGVPFPSMLPPIGSEGLALSAQGLREKHEDFDKMFGKQAYCGILKNIDLPGSNLGEPIGLIDPTVPLMPILDPFILLLSNLGVEPYTWLTEKIPKIIAKAGRFNAALVKLKSDCSTKDIKNLMIEINGKEFDGDIDGELKKLCELNWPAISIPDFPGFSLPGPFDLDFSIGFPTGFLFPDFDYPTINWAFQLAQIEIVFAMKKLKELGLKILEWLSGGINFLVKKIIEFLLLAIIDPLKEKLKPLLKGAVFAAALMALLSFVLPAIVVIMIGVLFGTGFLALTVAINTGLLV